MPVQLLSHGCVAGVDFDERIEFQLMWQFRHVARCHFKDRPPVKVHQTVCALNTKTMATGMIPGYHSTAEYHFCDEQADAICRTTAYHRRDYSLALIWFSAREHTDIRSSIATPFRTTADTGLGSLNRLPLELWYDVLVRMPY